MVTIMVITTMLYIHPSCYNNSTWYYTMIAIVSTAIVCIHSYYSNSTEPLLVTIVTGAMINACDELRSRLTLDPIPEAPTFIRIAINLPFRWSLMRDFNSNEISSGLILIATLSNHTRYDFTILR